MGLTWLFACKPGGNNKETNRFDSFTQYVDYEGFGEELIDYEPFPAFELAATSGGIDITGERGGRVINPQACGEKIGAGGNYIEGSSVLKGKCNGNVKPPALRAIDGRKALEFRTKKSRSSSAKDRVELAWTGVYKFGERIKISARIKIPEGSDVTNQFFYLMQLWQCPGRPPIAGIRLKRGTSHTLQFITRGTVLEEEKRPSTRFKFDLTPGKWHKIDMTLRVNPNENGKAVFAVSVDGNMLGRNTFPYGFKGKNICVGGMPTPDTYRVKFGIYRGNERAKEQAIQFDALKISK